jgi:hypothetical protein
MALPATTRRVNESTVEKTNRRIQAQMERRLCLYAQHPEWIDDRLEELDREWDIERVLETNSSAVSLLGIVLGVLRGRRWLLLPIGVQGFLMQHALTGWCPPLPLLRRLGVRTQSEIETERYALKYLRGDFGELPPVAAEASVEDEARAADAAARVAGPV